jgi:hypothetical protein
VPLKVGVRGEAVINARGHAADGSRGVAFGEPGCELGSEVRLEIDERRNSVREMNLCWTFTGLGSQSVNRGGDARRIEVPFDQEPVSGDAAMERASGDAVEIGNVAARDRAKAIEIEVSVFGFEGIKGPLDKANVAAKGLFALREFELPADAVIAMSWKDGGHVGVKVGRRIVEADVGLGEANHCIAIESTKDLAASLIGDDVGDVRLGVERVVGPHFTGDLHATMEVREIVERANDDRHRSSKF